MRRRGLRLDRESFERLVVRALDTIPEPFASWLSNMAVVIENDPDPEVRATYGSLLGLYEGVPFTAGDEGFAPAIPPRIIIYQRPHERCCLTLGELRAEVRETVLHEIAHQFGLSDEELEAMGPLRRQPRHR